MDFICLHDKGEIEGFLKQNTYLHLYSLGDLDDFFWPYTVWFGQKNDGRLSALALLYVGMPLPTLLALSDELEPMSALLTAIAHLLPLRFYAHLSPGLEEALSSTHELRSHGQHHKMALLDSDFAREHDFSDVVQLSCRDLSEIRALYDASYPGNWFDPRMLETARYMGIRENRQLVSIAGIHVYSRRYQVAALGNIASLPSHRNEGYATRVTAQLSRLLLEEELAVGLNVKHDNRSAIECYHKIGFRQVASYEEFTVRRI